MKRSLILAVLVFWLCTTWAKSGKYRDLDEDNGGPSSQFKPLSYEWTMEDIQYTPHLSKHLYSLQRSRSITRKNAVEENPLIKTKEDEKFFKSLPGILQNIGGNLEHLLSKTKIKGLVTGRIKSISSLIERMKQFGISDYREITDIIGLRVTLQTLNDITAFKYAYQKEYDTQITEIRCYGVCGPAVSASDDRRETKYWPWKDSGYRRLHYKIAIPDLDTEAEIQIGTPYMTLWAEWHHAVVYKGPENLRNNKTVKSYALQLAEYYMMMDNIRNGYNPNCPDILKSTSAKSIFLQSDWEKFGKPNDACNFWNDLHTDM